MKSGKVTKFQLPLRTGKQPEKEQQLGTVLVLQQRTVTQPRQLYAVKPTVKHLVPYLQLKQKERSVKLRKEQPLKKWSEHKHHRVLTDTSERLADRLRPAKAVQEV